MRSRLLVALSLVIAVPLAAQSPSRGAEPVGGTWVVRGMPSIQRAVVGIVVNTAMPSNDETGYPITLITPGSPADRAGLRTGDYVTRVNGQPLTSAAVQLWLLQSRLTPDDTVAIEYRRGNLRRTVHLVPMVVNEPPLNGALGSLHRAEAVTVPDEWEGSVFAYRLANPRSALMNIELAPLNPDLGRYFGSDDGVLVISIPRESSLNLRGGDVVLSIDGRRPDGPSNLIRILRTYAPDDTIRFEVLRSHKRHVVVGQLR
ncbi:MAG TPA: PDZ domain-containing protein [Gemmatimonadales bacterium]|nr:PDZ domain-containing protein [Gemmatimonadales bacterium]